MSTEEQNNPLGDAALKAAARAAVEFEPLSESDLTGMEYSATHGFSLDGTPTHAAGSTSPETLRKLGETIAPPKPANNNNNPLTLVSNREEEPITRAEAEEAALGLLVKMNLTRSDPGVGDVIASIENATTRSELHLAIASALSELQMVANEKTQAASSGGDLERQQLWGEIGRLNNEVRDILRPHMSEEERKQDDEFRERIRNARTEEERLAIQREYTRWRQQVVDDWRQSGDPEKEKAANRAQPGLDKIKRREEEILRNRRQTREGNAAIEGTAPAGVTAHVGRTQEGSGIIASGEANIASLGDLPSGTTATTARRPNGDPLDRV